MNAREFLGKMNSRGAAPIALLIVVMLVVMAGAVTYLAYRDMTGGGGLPLTGLPSGQAGGTTDAPSFQVSLFDPVTNESTEGSVILFKNGERIGSFSSTSGTISITNLDPNTTYLFEVEPGSSTSWYPFQTSETTYNTGPKRVGLAVRHMLNDAMTGAVFNNDNRTANSTSARQAIGASDKKSFYVQLQAPSTTNDNNYFGDGQIGSFHQFDLNSVEIQSVEAEDDAGTMDCITYTKVAGHTANADGNLFAHLGCVSAVREYKANTDYDMKLTFTSTARDPSSASADSNGSIFATVYDGCRVLNTNEGQYQERWRNPANLNDICVTTLSSYVLYYS